MAKEFDEMLGLSDQATARVKAAAQPCARNCAQAASVVAALKAKAREGAPGLWLRRPAKLGGANEDHVAGGAT